MLLERDDFRKVNPQKGRFRSFLLTALQHFLINEWEKGQAQKRGGGKLVLSLDFESAESRFDIQPPDATTAECIFHRQWALTLLQRVQTRLRQEMESRGNHELFASLQPRLVDDPGAEKLVDIGSAA